MVETVLVYGFVSPFLYTVKLRQHTESKNYQGLQFACDATPAFGTNSGVVGLDVRRSEEESSCGSGGKGELCSCFCKCAELLSPWDLYAEREECR